MANNLPSVIREVRGQLDNMDSEFRMALPPHINVEKFKRVAMTAIQSNASLLGADRKSLFGSCVRAAQDGLLPDGREAALVIFGNAVQYMPMIGGILKRIRNSGEVSTTSAQIVHRNDSFRYWVDGDGEHLEHEPLMFGDRGEIVGAYAVAKTKDGAVYIEVMTKSQIEKVRNVSRSKNNGPWVQWWEEMARKTVMRRLSKRLPMSTDIEDILRREEESYPESNGPVPPRPTLSDFNVPDDAIDAEVVDAPADHGGHRDNDQEVITAFDAFGEVIYEGVDRAAAVSELAAEARATKSQDAIQALREHNEDLWADVEPRIHQNGGADTAKEPATTPTSKTTRFDAAARNKTKETGWEIAAPGGETRFVSSLGDWRATLIELAEICNPTDVIQANIRTYDWARKNRTADDDVAHLDALRKHFSSIGVEGL